MEETETPEVITPEIVPNEESHSSVGHIAVLGLAVVGAVQGAKFVARKLPFTLTRKSKAVETPEVVTPIETPVVAE